MEQFKRQQNDIFHHYDDSKRKKIRSNINDCLSQTSTMACFEHLPNELMHEIFEFLDYFHVYEAFFNMNIRFRNLISNSSLPIKIKISSISKSAYQRYYTDIIMPHANRISSIHLSNVFIYDIVSSPIRTLPEFRRLQRLILDNIESTCLRQILLELISFSGLSSLTISSDDNIKNKNFIYHQIFRLPALKYCKLSLRGWTSDDNPLPLVTNECSPIEHFIINHGIYLNEVNGLVSYTPQLRCFSAQLGRIYSIKKTTIDPPTLNHLTHVFLVLCDISFSEFEQLAIDFFSRIQVLRISITYHRDTEYTDNNRWEQLISTRMLNLRIFDIRHESWSINFAANDNNSSNDPIILDGLINQFISPFWIERKWFFAVQYNQARCRNRKIFYSTNPYRRKHYALCKQSNEEICLNHYETNIQSVHHLHIESENESINCMNYFPNVTELTFEDGFSTNSHSFSTILNRIIPLKQLSKLVLECHHISFMKLIELLRFTPNIHTLVFQSMPFYRDDYMSIQHNETFQLVSTTNKITNVTFKDACILEKARLLIALCPQLQYLFIKTRMKYLESITRLLLESTNKNTGRLCSLCFLEASNRWLKTVSDLIIYEMLLDDYMLKLVDSKLYLWW
ncbi:unnamed protein product [Rotaria magnacalcarata]|uniref:F-box domain-containing protein n=1 Tax=Rotaria magnacalcarata TaxID=392030 RepID=A0A819N954_9BILA|nr:unnamed protein product [Rotaria magnacalcarata]CAF3994173.1 unnamed protein product [Rotaria magnacalcarata]